MGHTHYWTLTNKPNKTNYKNALQLIGEFVLYARDEKDYMLAGGSGDPRTSVEVWDGINFNGVGHDSCENFALDKKPAGGFKFCKTYQRPYDAVVVGALLLLKGQMGKDVDISSDGIGRLGEERMYFDLAEGINLLIDFLCDKKEFPRGEITKNELIKKMVDWFNDTDATIDYEKIYQLCN